MEKIENGEVKVEAVSHNNEKNNETNKPKQKKPFINKMVDRFERIITS